MKFVKLCGYSSLLNEDTTSVNFFFDIGAQLKTLNELMTLIDEKYS